MVYSVLYATWYIRYRYQDRYRYERGEWLSYTLFQISYNIYTLLLHAATYRNYKNSRVITGTIP